MKNNEAAKRSLRGCGKGAARLMIAAAEALLVIAAGTGRCYAAEAMQSLNSCGIENRSLSVDPTGKIEGFSAVLYNNMNGLPTSEANAIAETEEGFIWIGSYAGLIRYDGNTFERLDSTGGLTSIKSLYVDSRGRLWIGTNDNGVAVMENGEFKQWGKLDGMCSAHTRDITEDNSGFIYVGTNKGIMVLDQDLNLIHLDDPEISETDMRYLRTADDGTVYGTSDIGELVILRDGKLVKYIGVEDNPLDGTGSVLPDPGNPGVIYQEGPDCGLYHVDLNNGFEILEKIDIDPLRSILNMEYIDGKIWICAGNGIGVLEDNRFYMMDNLPMNNNVGHVMTDYLGNLWFTSTRQGVMKIVPNQFSDLFVRYDIPETVVNATSLCEGKLFLATDTGLMVLDENGLVTELPLKKAVTASGLEVEADDLIEYLTDCRIRSVIRDSRDRLWISTWRAGGLLRYENGELTVFSKDDGLLSNNIRAVSEREDGTILVALTGGTNIIKDDEIIASYGKEDGIENTESLTVTEGLNGEILLGSNGGGIYVINDSGLRNINVEEGLPSDIVLRLKKDTRRGLIWIVTSNAIAYMTPDYQVTSVQKFPYPNNFDLFETNAGDMWILSSNGIYVVPTEELIANGEINPVFYNASSGLPCITTANSYSDLTPEGDLYIAGSTGVCKVNIEKPSEEINNLKAVVPYMMADGVAVYPDEYGTMTIPSTTHKLTIQGFVYNYALSDPLITYQLEGFDQQSTMVRRSEMLPLDYTNLRGGTYYFTMEISDSLGRESKVVTVKIVKEKAFYEQTLFLILVGVAALILVVACAGLYARLRMRKLEKKHQEMYDMFEQTAEALASAIDAKDTYTNGHSRRVAEYSEKIAKEAGKTQEECDRIYFAALLHDVGKIGVPIEILTKKGRLTDEEFESIKQHPVAGGQILSNIHRSPWLAVGARYHHERMNGKGYPEGLKGSEIPEIARIIAVADAYDAMTSNRSYRKAIPQHIVREEIVKGIGTQFDPEFARIMIHMIDLDTEYRMQESARGANILPATVVRCDTMYHDCTEGISVTDKAVRIHFCCQPDDDVARENSLPTLILFDALDGMIHPGEEENPNLLYFEYAQIRLDNRITSKNTRKIQTLPPEQETIVEQARPGEPEKGQRYAVEAVRFKDHMLVKISDENRTISDIIALPDATRHVFVAIGGERCCIHNMFIETSDVEAGPDTIPRIADEVSFIKGFPQGDVPNVQIDDWCSDASEGIPLEDGLTVSFHTMSLPTARLVWHCPYISVFTSADGSVHGEGYSEYLLLRLNGEDWTSCENVDNDVQIEYRESFAGWEVWKKKNREGMNCSVEIRREKNRIFIETENLGVAIKSSSEIHDLNSKVYIALTGDQCAITDIHISHDAAEGG